MLEWHRTWPVKSEYMQAVHALERELEASRRDASEYSNGHVTGIVKALEALRPAIEDKSSSTE